MAETARAVAATAAPRNRWNRTKPASSPHAHQARSGDAETGVSGSNHRTHRTGAYCGVSDPSNGTARTNPPPRTRSPRASVRGRAPTRTASARSRRRPSARRVKAATPTHCFPSRRNPRDRRETFAKSSRLPRVCLFRLATPSRRLERARTSPSRPRTRNQRVRPRLAARPCRGWR